MYSEEEDSVKQPLEEAPTVEELLKPQPNEIVMYVKDPNTGEFKAHLIAKGIAPADSLSQPQQVNANEGGVVNVNQPTREEGDGDLTVLFKTAIPALFSFIIIVLCCYKIVNDEQTAPELRAVYWSTLTGTAASWLPSAATIRRKN